jgi:hypothetical protein
MAGGNKQVSKQTTTSGPWPPAQKYLRGAMQKAANLAQNKKGFNPYPGQSYVPFSGETEAGLGQIQGMAGQPNPFYAGNAGFNQGLVGGQYDLDQSGYQNLAGNAINTEGDYRTMFDQTNPLFEQVVNTQAGKIGDDVARQFGGASFGSAASTGALVDQIGDYRNKMASENFYNLQNLKRGLLGDITGLQGQNRGFEMDRLGAMAGLSQQDIQNRLAGVGQSDQIYQSQFAPAERMLGVGAAREAKAGEALQAQMDKFDVRQQAPWNRLGAAYPYFTGTGGSTQQTTMEQPTDPWGRILGGGLLASQALSPGGMFNQGGGLFR